MKCKAARRWLSLDADSELPDSEKRELAAHLEQCASCAWEYRILTLPQRMAREIPPWPTSPFFYPKLKARIEGEEARSRAGWQVLWHMARGMVPALAGITLALLSVLVFFQLRGPEADIYRAYDGVLITEDQPHGMLINEQGDITDASVLSAIAEGESGHKSSELK